MSDRELLELAAKAAGIVGTYRADVGICPPELHEHHRFYWNPLTDDSDAFRLALTLGIDIYSGSAGKEVKDGIERESTRIHAPISMKESDIYAATRACIVRVAADIGRNL